MLWTRRQALRTLIAAPVAAVADAGWRDAGAASAPRPLAHYILENRAKEPSPRDSFHSFGMAFVQGDVPVGWSPALLLENGAALPLQADMRASWPDGSLRWADLACRHPSIPAAGESALVIAAQQDAPAAHAPLAIDAVTTRSDLALAVSGLTDSAGRVQGSGHWIFAANRACRDARRVSLARQGPVCMEWRVWDALRDAENGAPHPHLVGTAYLRVWRDAAGAPGPISFCLGLAQGWIGVPGPSLLSYDAVLRNGEAEIRRFTRRAPIHALGPDGTLRAPDHGFATGDAVMLESGGVATRGPIFYVHRLDGDSLLLYASGYQAQMQEEPAARPELGRDASLVRRIVHPHHSGWLALGADARLDWLGGERPTLHGLHDRAYLRRTGMLPPYDLAQRVDQVRDAPRRGYDPAPAYHPFGLASARVYTDAPGEHPQIGLLPGWCASAFLGQSEWHATRARINAVAAAGYPNRFLDERSLEAGPVPRIPTVLPRDFPGLAPARADSFWYAIRNSAGHDSAGHSPDVADVAGGDGAWMPGDTSHYPSPIYYTLLTEGGRHLMDLEIVWASYVLFNRDIEERRRRVDRIYDGIVMRNAYNIRADGWAMRELSYAAAIVPDADPERAYFRAALRENLDFAMATIAASSPAFRAGGHWGFKTEAVESPWMMGFVMQGMSMVAKQHPDMDGAGRFLDHLQTQIRAFVDPSPMLAISYRFLFRSHDTGGDYLLPQDFVYLLSGADSKVEVRLLADGRTLEHAASGIWQIRDGDRLRLTSFDENWEAATRVPAGLADRALHLVETDGNRFKVAERAGGTPLRWEGGSSGWMVAWWHPRAVPETRDRVGDPQGYYHVLRATLGCAAWAGLPGFSELHRRMTEANTTDLSGNPKYALSP